MIWLQPTTGWRRWRRRRLSTAYALSYPPTGASARCPVRFGHSHGAAGRALRSGHRHRHQPAHDRDCPQATVKPDIEYHVEDFMSLLGGLMNGHIALLGDSVLDNGAYTDGGPDVITQLRHLLPRGWDASLMAIDGSMIADLESQLSRVSAETTQLVISMGGNDVLSNLDVMQMRVKSSSEALIKLGQRIEVFEREYRHALGGALRLNRQTIICTIYNGNLSGATGAEAALLPDPAAARIGLMAFNDVVLRVAIEQKLRVIDLRLVCDEPADYANPIEPSSIGGEKIARAIMRALGLIEAGQSQISY